MNIFHSHAKPALAFSILAFLALLMAGCDTRKPIDSDGSLVRPPLLELSSEKDAIGVEKDTTMAIRAQLVSALHGTLSLREIRFTAKIGFIAPVDTTNDSGVAEVVYYTRNRNLSASARDTITATFDYSTADGSGSVSDTLFLRLIPGSSTSSEAVGSIELTTSRTAVQVKGSGTTDQAQISAHVYDINREPVRDGTKVNFTILSGPGGGESLGNGNTDTASTRDGVASVTFHGGTFIGVVEFQAASGGQIIRQSLLTVTSGPPAHIDITVRPDSLVTAGNRWRMEVQAALTDAYLNPVKDSIGVLFSLGAGALPPGFVSVQGSAYTGNLRCKDTTEAICKAVPGSAFSYISYRSEVVFDSLLINAETSTGTQPIRANRLFRAPLQKPVVKANYYGGAVKLPGFGEDTVQVEGELADGFGYLVPGATMCISTTSGEVPTPCQTTNAVGKAFYSVIVDSRDQTSLDLTKTVNVTLTETSSGAKGTTSFTLIFQ